MAFGKKSRSTLLGVLVIIGVVLFLIPRIHLGKDSLSGRPGDKLISDYDILESLVVGRDYWDIRPDRHPETLTLEGVSFALPDDYLASRILQLGNSEACVVFTGDSFFPGFARLVLRIYPDIADDIADEAVNEMLEAAVDNLAKMLVKDVEESGRELDYAYSIVIEDTDDFPCCYANLSWPGNKEDRFISHTEATLVNGKIVSGCAVALSDELLSDLIAIYGQVLSAIQYDNLN